ncbi:hypothetical protein SBA2_140002 [Acidobacteriia bacterium SbA2]|nr:hypothetical protein SBA2_140002 [Acidobacteriia bacterium SbA2]
MKTIPAPSAENALGTGNPDGNLLGGNVGGWSCWASGGCGCGGGDFGSGDGFDLYRGEDALQAAEDLGAVDGRGCIFVVVGFGVFVFGLSLSGEAEGEFIAGAVDEGVVVLRIGLAGFGAADGFDGCEIHAGYFEFGGQDGRLVGRGRLQQGELAALFGGQSGIHADVE